MYLSRIIGIIIIATISFYSCRTVDVVEFTPTVKEQKRVIHPVKEISFMTTDSVLVYADWYETYSKDPFILMCHQAGYNKYEYHEIAPKIQKMGYNVLVIDQRSGGDFGNQTNKTAAFALEFGKRQLPIKRREILMDYVSAEIDIRTAIEFLHQKSNGPIILWGSSYSSTLALYIGLKNKDIGAVLAFSPGNYLTKFKGSLKESLSNFSKPLFITSSRDEVSEIKELIRNLDLSEKQIHFIPEGEGRHGSKALWESSKDNVEYWDAVKNFLEKIR